jgi:hypothetical protein
MCDLCFLCVSPAVEGGGGEGQAEVPGGTGRVHQSWRAAQDTAQVRNPIAHDSVVILTLDTLLRPHSSCMVNNASCVLDALQIQEQEDGHPTFQEGPGTCVSHSRRGAGIETGNGQTPTRAGLNLRLAIVTIFIRTLRSVPRLHS